MTVIHLVNAAVDTVDGEGTLLLLPSAGGLVLGVGVAAIILL